jgi:uncharacterized protein (TIGR02117 family)
MEYLKIIIKYIGRAILGLFGVVLLYFILAFLLSVIPKNTELVDCVEKETVYLISNGIHLDIILNRNQIDTTFLKTLKIPETVKYVAFGWGDKGFYLQTKTWNDLKMNTLVNALFLKSESSMHVTSYYYKSENFVPLSLCPTQIEVLKTYIETSFIKTNTGEIIETGKGYGKNDHFYEAKGSYNAIKTCNEWVNIGLKKAKVKTSVWSPFDKGIFYHVR